MLLRIIIADNHPLLVEGLTRILEQMEMFDVVETATSGLQLMDRLRQTPADIVLLDLQMPQLDGIETLKIIKRDFPFLKVIVLSNYHQPKFIKEIKKAGAIGYFLKSGTSIELKEMAKAVAAGKEWFHHAVPATGSSNHFNDDFTKKYQVTKRELEIIKNIAEGLTSKEIGKKLFVSEFTINSHRRNICRKLNIYTPVGLLNFARDHGLV